MIPKRLKLEFKNASTYEKCKLILSHILAFAFLFGITLFLLYGLWCEIQLSLYGIEGSAVVIEKYQTHGKRRSVLKNNISYKFTADNNLEYTNTSNVPYEDYYKINLNDTVKIIFDPKNPDNNKMTVQYFLNMDTFGIIIFSFCPLLFFTMIVYYSIKNKRNKNLLKSGYKTNATITHIYYYITNDQQFDITYQFYDTHHRLYEKKLITVNKSETTSEKLEKNQSLVVYYNPKNPNQHVVPLLSNPEVLGIEDNSMKIR